MASGGHSSSRCAGLSLSRPLLLRSTGSRRAGSVIVAHGPSCSAACGISPDQVSNPCPLHQQADSQPLHHQGSPFGVFYVSHLPAQLDWKVHGSRDLPSIFSTELIPCVACKVPTLVGLPWFLPPLKAKMSQGGKICKTDTKFITRGTAQLYGRAQRETVYLSKSEARQKYTPREECRRPE